MNKIYSEKVSVVGMEVGIKKNEGVTGASNAVTNASKQYLIEVTHSKTKFSATAK